jgi:transcriptional regulator with XRE-family HTH domain
MPETSTPGPLGQKLQALREQAGLTLYELERRSGVNRAKLLRMESGVIRQPTPETLNKLASALDIDPEEFYDALWADTDSPLPSLATYFRSKYRLRDDQIEVIERALTEAKDKPGKSRAGRPNQERSRKT